MPATPWRTFGSPDPNGDFVALLTYLPLKSYWRVPSFFYTAQVARQLASAQGLLGYSVLARPGVSRAACYTASARISSPHPLRPIVVLMGSNRDGGGWNRLRKAPQCRQTHPRVPRRWH